MESIRFDVACPLEYDLDEDGEIIEVVFTGFQMFRDLVTVKT